MNDEVMNYDDLRPQCHTFRYRGKNYVLREAGTEVVADWRGHLMRSCITLPNGNRMIGPGTDITRLNLIAPCLFLQEDDGKEKKVTIVDLKSWAEPVIKDLFMRARKLCGDEEEVETMEGLVRRKEELEARIEKLKATAAEGTSSGETEEKTGPK